MQIEAIYTLAYLLIAKYTFAHTDHRIHTTQFRVIGSLWTGAGAPPPSLVAFFKNFLYTYTILLAKQKLLREREGKGPKGKLCAPSFIDQSYAFDCKQEIDPIYRANMGDCCINRFKHETFSQATSKRHIIYTDL